MFKLAGAFLRKPELLQRAARMSGATPAVKRAAQLASEGGSELFVHSLPGAAQNVLLSTLTTGDPVAGLGVGLADLAISYGGSRALAGSKAKLFGSNLSGQYKNYATADQVRTALETGKGINPAALHREYSPSAAQGAFMLGGSLLAPMALEPMVLKQQQQQAANQLITQSQQLGQQEMLNQMYVPQTADGTLYQTQGLPYRVTQGV